MAARRIRITGSGIYGQTTDENPSGEYPIGYEFDTDADLPASWVGRAEVVGEKALEGSTFVVNENDDSEAGKARNAIILQAQAEIDRLKADYLAETALLRDRAERAETDLVQAREQVAALTEKLKAFENGSDEGQGDAATTDEIKSAVDMLDAGNDAHWTDAGLPRVEAVSDLIGKDVTRKAISEAAPDAKRPA